MVLGIGIDLVEVERLAGALGRHGERFIRRVFTPAEAAACADRRDRLQALAARFAAKEACMKALGCGWAAGVGFTQIEVVRGLAGRPGLALHGAAARVANRLGAAKVHVSLTHQPSSAAAIVVLED